MGYRQTVVILGFFMQNSSRIIQRGLPPIRIRRLWVWLHKMYACSLRHLLWKDVLVHIVLEIHNVHMDGIRYNSVWLKWGTGHNVSFLLFPVFVDRSREQFVILLVSTPLNILTHFGKSLSLLTHGHCVQQQRYAAGVRMWKSVYYQSVNRQKNNHGSLELTLLCKCYTMKFVS